MIGGGEYGGVTSVSKVFSDSRGARIETGGGEGPVVKKEKDILMEQLNQEKK